MWSNVRYGHDGKKARLACFASFILSSLLGIPSDANRALGNKEVVLFSIDANVSMKLRCQSEGLFERTSLQDSPVTPPKSMLGSTSLWTRSRLCAISFRMSRWRTRNSCPSKVLNGGFLSLIMSAATTKDCRQRLTAS